MVNQHQEETYEEIPIRGDSSNNDITHATELVALFDVCYCCYRYRSQESDLIILEQNYALTWTLSPFSQNGYQAPSAVTLRYNDDSVFFAETVISQLLPNGSGFGTFDTERSSWAEEANGGLVSRSTLQAVAGNQTSGKVAPGSTLRCVFLSKFSVGYKLGICQISKVGNEASLFGVT